MAPESAICYSCIYVHNSTQRVLTMSTSATCRTDIERLPLPFWCNNRGVLHALAVFYFGHLSCRYAGSTNRYIRQSLPSRRRARLAQLARPVAKQHLRSHQFARGVGPQRWGGQQPAMEARRSRRAVHACCDEWQTVHPSPQSPRHETRRRKTRVRRCSHGRHPLGTCLQCLFVRRTRHTRGLVEPSGRSGDGSRVRVGRVRLFLLPRRRRAAK